MVENTAEEAHPAFYKMPIPESSNVRYVENRIVINAPHMVVYDFVTTWSNLPRWLPNAKNVYVRRGNLTAPGKLGDVLCEGVYHEAGFSAPATLADKVYTVVVHVPGTMWSVAGVDDTGDPWIGKTATFITQPLGKDKTLFCRVFQQIRKEGENREDRHSVLIPQKIQKGLEQLKCIIENETGTEKHTDDYPKIWDFLVKSFTSCWQPRQKRIVLR